MRFRVVTASKRSRIAVYLFSLVMTIFMTRASRTATAFRFLQQQRSTSTRTSTPSFACHQGITNPIHTSRIAPVPTSRLIHKSRLLSTSSRDTASTEESSFQTRSVSTSINAPVTTSRNDGGTTFDSTNSDTIFALSSGTAVSQATALAVIRLSGPQAAHYLQQLTNNKPLPKPRVATLRRLTDPFSGQPVDHALVLYFPAPNSFTGEDVVELHCHGSRAVVTAVTDALLSFENSRLAEPGEFTQRAWWAGKFDALQVEALADLLTADTSTQRLQALQQLDGKLSQIYADWRSTLIAGLAHAEAVIDFGDDEHLDDDDAADSSAHAQWNIWGGVIDSMTVLRNNMQKQLQDARRGELIREGIQIAIVGPPNAGKSSLFNLLAERDAAIVSPTAGTTRDILEVSLNLGGVKCIVQDTAGVRRSTDDDIEREGMKRAQAAAAKADLVVAMVDGTERDVGLQILKNVMDQAKEELTSAQILLVLNKSDLMDASATSDNELPGISVGQIGGVYRISCVTQQGIDVFLDSLSDAVVSRVSGNMSLSDESVATEGALITRARHRQHVQTSVEALDRFIELSQQGSMTVDLAAEELRLAASELGRITGAVDVEDVLDKLFADFCIGK